MNTTLAEIYDEMISVGFPTFEDFVANKEKTRETVNSMFGTIDRSTNIFRGLVRKQTYKFRNYDSDTLEGIENIMLNEGVNPLDCTFHPEIVDTTGGKCTICVTYKEKCKEAMNESLLTL